MLQSRIGYGVFDSGKMKKLNKLMLSEARRTLHEEEQWWICHGEFVDQSWDIIFSLMKEALTYKLQLGRNLRPKIIKQVGSTKFTNLKQLCFGKNNIANIEDIVKIDAPLLEWLSFQQNKLTSVRPLRKAFFPNLKILNLKFNKLKQINLSEFNAPSLTKICLQLYYTQPKQCEAVQWAFKLQTTRLAILRCRNADRIANSLIEKQLAQKYQGIDYKKYSVDSGSESESDH